MDPCGTFLWNFKISPKPFPQGLLLQLCWESPKGFIKCYIWRDCERALQEAVVFKMKGHTYKDIISQSLLLPPLPVLHEDTALPHWGTRGQSSTTNTARHLGSYSTAAVCQTALFFVIMKAAAWEMSVEISLHKTSLQIQLTVSLKSDSVVWF